MWQDEDKRPQLGRNFDAIRALLCTKEVQTVVSEFGMQVRASAPRMLQVRMLSYMQNKYGVPGSPTARPLVYKVLNPVFCILTCIQRAPTNTIVRVVLLESRKFQQLDGPDNPSDYDKLRRVRICDSRTETTSL